MKREIFSKFKLRPLSLLLILSLVSSFFILPLKIVKSQETITGIGIIGDSGSDEYRADDNRAGGTIYAPTTLGWVELLGKYRDLNFGVWSDTSRGEPRRKGYEYNWARTGYTSGQMISSGMHTGVAAQIQQGEISHVYMQIGGNDFGWWNGNYQAIYNGTLAGDALQNKINSIITNIALAIDTVKAAGNVKMVVATVGDSNLSSYVVTNFPDPVKRQRVSDAINAVNNGIISVAQSRNVVVVDSNAIALAMLSKLDANGFLDVGGEKIDTKVNGDEPHHLMLSDNIHAGTVAEGLLQANELFIKAFNANYNTNIPLFTDQEILQNAGINPPSPSPTLISSPTPSATPTISPALTATPTSTPTDTPTPTTTPTLTPTPTSTPTLTPTPTSIPSPSPTPTKTPIPTLSPTPTPITRIPFYYRVMQGRYISGGLSNLASNDNKFFIVRSNTSGASRGTTTDFTFNGFNRYTATKVTVNLILKSSVSATNAVVYLYYSPTQGFTQIDSFSLSRDESTRNTIFAGNLLDYIDTQGQLRIRVVTSKNSTTHDISFEQLRVTVQ